MGVRVELNTGENVENFYIFEFKDGKIMGFQSIHLTSFSLIEKNFQIKVSSHDINIMGENLRILVSIMASGRGFYMKEDSARFQEKPNVGEIWIDKIEIEELGADDEAPVF